MAKRKLPTICIDEHVSSTVSEAFAETGFRTIQAGKSLRFKGRDEFNYLAELYADNAIFVTEDGRFFDKLAAGAANRHAGVVLMPVGYPPEVKGSLASLIAGLIKVWVSAEGQRSMRGLVLYSGT